MQRLSIKHARINALDFVSNIFHDGERTVERSDSLAEQSYFRIRYYHSHSVIVGAFGYPVDVPKWILSPSIIYESRDIADTGSRR